MEPFPTSPCPSGKGVANLPTTGADGWSNDGTDRAVAWLESGTRGATGGKTARRGKLDVRNGRGINV